ncbi:rRNA-processing protein LAS1 [Paracoccidioides brasiliensis Pb18]|uniref:Cell morphogenesis protein Las1 n=1 Tax=Paracoccidioides brasiliensis (strain Pb18) TaxID=502780 RepID=A0A0A0HTZ1_PARBD|nr:rRNA-processing protein LAS1 [Paracoccidioides brasiliensis Pb18]KGM91743.1 hypothetical protein PADG_12203 [Paracoccidioides brasiliensis Pb18]ODH46391.1 hypothetical protein GX48_07518 [Paracoccidioides brasiliensis]
MPRLQFTPWKELSELLAIRSQFYPSTSEEPADMRAKACSLVWVWKLRGNLPHSVEATALLTDAILHDDAKKNSIFSIRATYSAAFCRFVTGLVDSKLYGRKQTMFQKATELGLPASFVELRHEATHRELPSLSVLRNAAHRSLQWLWKFYWVGLPDIATADPGIGAPGLSDGSRSVKDVIQQSLKTVVFRSSENSAKRKRPRMLESARVLENLTSICSQQGEGAIVEVLLEEGFLVPASRTLGNPMEPVFSTWDGYLKKLCQQHATFLTVLSGELARVLIDSDSTASEGDPYKEAVYLWLRHILNSNSWATVRKLNLSMCYVNAVCSDASGYWVDHLRSPVDQYSHNLDTDIQMEAGGYVTSEIGKGNDAVVSGTEGGSLPDAADMQADSDSNILRSCGWNIDGSWRYKSIGVV